MELVGQQSSNSYRRLAEEIGEVLQAAAETADKMQEDARIEAARIREAAEADRLSAYTEGRRILDEARMEADMIRAEAEWQAQEVVAQARRQAAERIAGADSRLADLAQAETRVIDRLAGVGQVLAETLATLREGATAPPAPGPRPESNGTAPVAAPLPAVPPVPADSAEPSGATGAGAAAEAAVEDDELGAKVYFVEFPPAAPAPADPVPASAEAYIDPEDEIILTDSPGPSLFHNERERSEWAPPADVDMPTWWTRGGAQA